MADAIKPVDSKPAAAPPQQAAPVQQNQQAQQTQQTQQTQQAQTAAPTAAPKTETATAQAAAPTDTFQTGTYSKSDKMMTELTDWMKSSGKGDVPIEKMKDFLESKGYQVERNGKHLNIKDESGNTLKVLSDNDGDGNIGMKDSSFRDAVSQLEQSHPEMAGIFNSLAKVSQWGKQGGKGHAAAEGLGAYGDLAGLGGLGGLNAMGQQFGQNQDANVMKLLAPVQAQLDQKGVQADAFGLWQSNQLAQVAAQHGIELPPGLPAPNASNPFDTFKQASALALAPHIAGGGAQV